MACGPFSPTGPRGWNGNKLYHREIGSLMQKLPLLDLSETVQDSAALTDVAGIHIAVAEDDPSDLMQLEMVLDQIGLAYTLTVALDGEEARDFILKRGRYRGFPPAQLILMDMHMPKLTGLEVLRSIPDSAELPVCILTNSQRERELVERHFAPKKVCYMTKPIDSARLLECFRFHDHLRNWTERFVKS